MTTSKISKWRLKTGGIQTIAIMSLEILSAIAMLNERLSNRLCCKKKAVNKKTITSKPSIDTDEERQLNQDVENYLKCSAKQLITDKGSPGKIKYNPFESQYWMKSSQRWNSMLLGKFPNKDLNDIFLEQKPSIEEMYDFHY